MHDNGGERRYLLQRVVTQLFCLNKQMLKRNVIKRREVLHGPQGRTLLATLYHSDGPLAVACSRRNFDLLHPPSFPQRSEDLAKHLLKSKRHRFLKIGHASIFKIDATTLRHYSAFMWRHYSACQQEAV